MQPGPQRVKRMESGFDPASGKPPANSETGVLQTVAIALSYYN
jgi:hypothetical protein